MAKKDSGGKGGLKLSDKEKLRLIKNGTLKKKK